jgi:hypothetical protein
LTWVRRGKKGGHRTPCAGGLLGFIVLTHAELFETKTPRLINEEKLRREPLLSPGELFAAQLRQTSAVKLEGGRTQSPLREAKLSTFNFPITQLSVDLYSRKPHVRLSPSSADVPAVTFQAAAHFAHHQATSAALQSHQLVGISSRNHRQQAAFAVKTKLFGVLPGSLRHRKLLSQGSAGPAPWTVPDWQGEPIELDSEANMEADAPASTVITGDVESLLPEDAVTVSSLEAPAASSGSLDPAVQINAEAADRLASKLECLRFLASEEVGLEDTTEEAAPSGMELDQVEGNSTEGAPVASPLAAISETSIPQSAASPDEAATSLSSSPESSSAADVASPGSMLSSPDSASAVALELNCLKALMQIAEAPASWAIPPATAAAPSPEKELETLAPVNSSAGVVLGAPALNGTSEATLALLYIQLQNAAQAAAEKLPVDADFSAFQIDNQHYSQIFRMNDVPTEPLPACTGIKHEWVNATGDSQCFAFCQGTEGRGVRLCCGSSTDICLQAPSVRFPLGLCYECSAQCAPPHARTSPCALEILP